MKTTFYLKVNSKGGITTTKNRPNVDWNEVTISIRLDIPDELFKRPQLNAVISIPDSAAQPQNIDVDIQDNIKDAIETLTGLNVRLSIESEEG